MGVRVSRIDANADGVEDLLGLAAPYPGRRRQVGKAGTAFGVHAVARRAVVAEQRISGRPNDRHELGIGQDRWIVLLEDLVAPDTALGRRLLQRSGDDLALIDAEQAPGVGRAK